MFIYCIENSVNGKKYVGCTMKNNPNVRWAEHKREAKQNRLQYPLYKAIRKYGIDKFAFNVIDECISSDEMYEAEKEWIDKFNTFRGDGYNANYGGRNPVMIGVDNPMFGRHISEQQKKLISKAQKGRKHSEAHKRKVSEAGKGRKHSEETKQKLRKASVGRTHSNETKRKISRAKIGRRLPARSKEYRQKLSICKNNTKKAVLQCTLEQVLIAEYESISEASRQTNIFASGIRRVCKNTRKSAGNFIWRFKN